MLFRSLDEEGNYLITSDESYEQYMQTKKASEIQEKEMQEKEQPLLQKVFVVDRNFQFLSALFHICL